MGEIQVSMTKLRQRAWELARHFDLPAAYDAHYLPWDTRVRELGTGKSRVEILQELGLHVQVQPQLSVKDGIEAVRMMLPKCWFDKKNTEQGYRALLEYTKEPLEGMIDPYGKQLYRDKPLHNWASHGADAIRTLAVGLKPKIPKPDSLHPKLSIV